jgi:ubiquinone/menaquinone biosynthesis C-methylase UbiE
MRLWRRFGDAICSRELAMSDPALESYVIKGGREGRERLAAIARALKPSTSALLDHAGSISGARVVDVACGGGAVTFLIAERVGAQGHVFGLDLDESKLELARAEAAQRGIANVTFHTADVTRDWPARDVQLVYMRFILTHLSDPAALLTLARDRLTPGGAILVEDIDHEGRFWDPPSPALDRASELYKAVARRNGGDPLIGRRLGRLLEAAGFSEVETALVQPYGVRGDAKRTAVLTFTATKDAMLRAGLGSAKEIDDLEAELEAFTQRSDTTISMPRIFQAWGRR